MRKTTIIALVVLLAGAERGQDSITLAQTVEVNPTADMNDTAKRLVRSLAYGSMTSELIRHEHQRYQDLSARQQQLAATALVEFVASLNGGSWDMQKRLRASLILGALSEFKTAIACRRIDSRLCLPTIKKRKKTTSDPYLKEALELAIGSSLKEDDALTY